MEEVCREMLQQVCISPRSFRSRVLRNSGEGGPKGLGSTSPPQV